MTEDPRDAEPLVVRLAITLVGACMTSAFLYALLRIVQALLMKEPDPALVIYSEHAGFFWRAWISVYAGGMIGFAAYIGASRDAARTLRWIARSFALVVAVVVAQGWLVP